LDFKLRYDLHTHTLYSHGKGGILDNVKSASEKGLSMIGISDHGPGHKLFGTDLSKVPDMRRDIDEARSLFPNVDIKLSVEANIINPSGRLDVSLEDQKLFDYVLAGYHYGVLGEKPLKAIGVCIGGCVKLFSNKAYNTDLVVRALYENNIKMLTHPGDKAAFDIDEIAKACEKTNTIMEINNHHNGLSVQGIKTAAKYDVKFAISSDAHVPSNVGCCDKAMERVMAAGLPLSRIINLWN